MLLHRFFARLDIKGPNVVKGVCMEGLRVIGTPGELARRYVQGCMELLYIDTVASLYGRNQLEGLLRDTVRNVFVPITVGGGIKSLYDVRRLLNAGADVVAINTAAIKRPELISEISNVCGRQAVCVSIEAKKTSQGWECYAENGRERTGRDVVTWAREAVERGAGELLITSVDRDGTMTGFDMDLMRAVGTLPVPIIVGGGAGRREDVTQLYAAGIAGAACGAALHYNKFTVKEIVDGLAERKFRPAETGEERGKSARTASRVSEEGA